MIAVSSVGAAAHSANFYLRTKGEVEEALRALNFLARPDAPRPAHRRPAGRRGLARGWRCLPRRSPTLLHGSLRRYRSIPAETVARAIVAAAWLAAPGQFVHENDAMQQLAD